MYPNVLSSTQVSIIKRLDFFQKGVYLAGGTALALQMGHRTSFDFDFYASEHFESQEFLAPINLKFSGVTISNARKDTCLLSVEGVSCSFFYYPYKMIKPLVAFENINLASIEDIAAMKMIAISMRGKRRDFVDAYYLLKRFDLEEIMKFTLKKYPEYQPLAILKGLIFFSDAENEDVGRGIEIFDKDFFWESAKNEIFKEVEKYQQGMLSARKK